MIRIMLALITCSVFAGCMTQADKALWLEAKETLGGKSETVTAEAPVEATAPAQELKTSSKDSKDKEESAVPMKDEGLAPKPSRAN